MWVRGKERGGGRERERERDRCVFFCTGGGGGGGNASSTGGARNPYILSILFLHISSLRINGATGTYKAFVKRGECGAQVPSQIFSNGALRLKTASLINSRLIGIF